MADATASDAPSASPAPSVPGMGLGIETMPALLGELPPQTLTHLPSGRMFQGKLGSG